MKLLAGFLFLAFVVGCRGSAGADPDSVVQQTGDSQLSIIAVSNHHGRFAVLAGAPPWQILHKADFAEASTGLRCLTGRCFVFHASGVTVVDMSDFSTQRLAFDNASDPRDIVELSANRAVISLAGTGSLAFVDLGDLQVISKASLDLELEDSSVVRPAKLTRCGDQLYVALLQSRSLAVVDINAQGGNPSVVVVDVDPTKPGAQGVALAHPTQFEMHAECATRKLYVAEPQYPSSGPVGVMHAYQEVDLESLTAQPWSFNSPTSIFGPDRVGGGAGGFAMVSAPRAAYIIHHTEFPTSSSHIFLYEDQKAKYYGPDIFSKPVVDDVEVYYPTAASSGVVLFPNACTEDVYPGCPGGGIYVYDAKPGDGNAVAELVQVGFPVTEVEVVSGR